MVWRAGAAGISAVAAAAAGVVTALVTAHPSIGLWVALGGLVVIGAALQAAVVAGERHSERRADSDPPIREAGPTGPGRSATGDGDVRNTISGGVQFGAVLQGRDIQATFGSPTLPPWSPPSQEPGAS